MNVSTAPINSETLPEIFFLLGQPARLNILLAINSGQACVCHLESVLGLRQAYISQQLMLLRDAGLVQTERSGRHIYYSLTDLRWLELIRQAAAIQQVTLPRFDLPEIQGCEYNPAKPSK
jgi:DNA-binding transcriptional ArsR family regulator